MKHLLLYLLWFAASPVFAQNPMKTFTGAYPGTPAVYTVTPEMFLEPSKTGKERVLYNLTEGDHLQEHEQHTLREFAAKHPGVELYVLGTLHPDDMMGVARQIGLPVFIPDPKMFPVTGNMLPGFYSTLGANSNLAFKAGEKIPKVWLVCEEGNVVDYSDSFDALSKYFQN